MPIIHRPRDPTATRLLVDRTLHFHGPEGRLVRRLLPSPIAPPLPVDIDLRRPRIRDKQQVPAVRLEGQAVPAE